MYLYIDMHVKDMYRSTEREKERYRLAAQECVMTRGYSQRVRHESMSLSCASLYTVSKSVL